MLDKRELPAVLAALLAFVVAWGGAAGAALADDGEVLPAAVTSTRDEIDLNGTWSFTAHDGGLGPGVTTTIRVPDAWDAAPGFYDTTSATYERSVDIPASWAGQSIWLEIYEANWHVHLTVNDVTFDSSEGIGVPTNIDVTSAVNPGQDNLIQIQVTQAGLSYAGVRPAGTFRWGQNLGLTGDVALRSYPKTRVIDAFVQTSVRNHELTADIQIGNDTGVSRELTVESRVLELSGAPVLDLPGQAVTVGDSPVSLTLQQAWYDPVLWNPDQPHLYYLETTLKENDDVVDVHRVRFGFREVWTEGTDLLLNGTPVVLLADSNDLFQHAFMNYYYQLWYDEEATRATIAKLKESRNAIRIHQAPAVRPHVLDLFDEQGVLVIAESAVYGGSYNQAGQPSFNAYIQNALNWIPKWIQRERNHASIVVWSAENELGPGWLTLDEAQLSQLGARIRAYDPTRPIIFEGDHDCCGSDFNSLHYNSMGPGGDWPSDNDVYAHARDTWVDTLPNSQNEYAFVGWNGNGIYEFTDGSSSRNLTSMQGTRLRGGLLTRGFRYQGWAMMAPHTYIWQWADFYGPEDRIDDAFVERSFLPVAAFDVEYDRLGENPLPPVIPSSQSVDVDLSPGSPMPRISAGEVGFMRDVVVYNQDVGGSGVVTLIVEARIDGAPGAFYTYSQDHAVPLGGKKIVPVSIQGLPPGSHWIQLEYKVVKDGVERFAGETRDFWLEGPDSQAPPAPTGLDAQVSGGSMGVLDRNMVYLSWDMPEPRGDLLGWAIYRDTEANPTSLEDEVKLWGEPEKFDAHNEYFDVVPGPGTYTYRLAARDLAGNLSAYSNQVTVTVVDSESPLRDPGLEMESRLYKDADNQYYDRRSWGEAWTLPAILGGRWVRPHGGCFAGLINGDGAHAENAFLDKFFFIQQVPRIGETYHLGGYVRVDKIWRTGIVYDPDYWIPEGLRLAAVGGNGEFWNTRYADVVISPDTLQQWEGDGRWHYVYGRVSPTSEPFNIIAKVNGEGDHDPIEPLLDAYVDDLVLTPLDRIPPVALTSASAISVSVGQAVDLDARASFAFDGAGRALAPDTGLVYSWDLGDGRTSSWAAPQVFYAAPGEYVARVTVRDEKGLAATAQVFVTVTGVALNDAKVALPTLARHDDLVTFTVTLAGTGNETTMVDALPAQLDYVSAQAFCPTGTVEYDAGKHQVVYDGMPPIGGTCTVEIVTRANVVQLMFVTNTAVIDDHVVAPRHVSAGVLLNPVAVYLPAIVSEGE